jgi:pyruvate kinase
MNKKTKIVCTIGPATESKEKLSELLKAGMNVMRLNFSHGDFAEHQNRVNNLKIAVKETGIPAATLQDLSGPKIRIGAFKTDSVMLKEGATFTLTTDAIVGDEKRVHVNYPLLPKEVKKGDTIFLHDGKKKLIVTNIKGNDVVTKILVGGEIKARRGVNLPDSDLSVSALTAKDKKDIEFGIKNDVDFFALSFVRKPEDIKELRVILNKRKSKAKIIAKIETPQALAAIDAIIAEADGVMVARGDLAIEIPAENVPLAQKMIIQKCNAQSKPVITATQMLESMIKSPVPTRAEVSDVANAIIDGTDAIMLSEETTLGEYPVKAVEVMSKIALKVENDVSHDALSKSLQSKDAEGVAESVTLSAVRTAERVGAKFVVSLTERGTSALLASSHKPRQPILVFTGNKKTFNQVLLSYGCQPVHLTWSDNFKQALASIRDYCLTNKIAKKGDRVVISSGMPFGEKIETSMMLVETL